MTFWRITVLTIVLYVPFGLKAQDLSRQANNFLNTLSSDTKNRAYFPLDNAERYNMNYVPIERKGPTFHDFNEEQKQAALDLLKASLSQGGYKKTREIMELEKVLGIMEDNRLKANGSPFRDPLDYHFCIFGEPTSENLWGWRFEGHHVSLNFTSTKGVLASSTPSFWGSNPGVVNIREQRGKEVLKRETELGFKLVNSLTTDQREIAIFSKKAPREIFSTNKRKVEGLEQKGIYYTLLSADQQTILMDLLNTYIDNYQLGFSRTLRARINKAGIENLSFAWAGSLMPEKGNYYRIQGPMLLIEYDNVQNNANHVHTVVRDLNNDFAEDILREHYQKSH